MNKTLSDNIKIYTNMVVGIEEDYKNREIGFDEYKEDIVYYIGVLNNLRRQTSNSIEWL